MCGGGGTRLWPLSTEARPKPFHALATAHTLFQDTVLRVAPDGALRFTPPIVVGGRAHLPLIQAQLAEIGVTPAAIALEPSGRGTAAVAVVAARLAGALHPGARMLLLPADHAVADPAAFRAAVARGLGLSEHIVVLGVEPTAPDTAYGYIQRGAPLGEGTHSVTRFVEKPSAARAEAYLAEGGYLWNAGVFLSTPEVLLSEMAAHRPDILAGADRALRAPADGVVTLDEACFAEVPDVSFDVAVMEHTPRAAVAPCAPGWADLGAFDALWRQGPHDEGGNRLQGEAVALDTTGSLVWADGVAVAVLGVADLVVVATPAAVIVLPRERAQEVRTLSAALHASAAAS
jgi:mannose-1-phosphate guanylyltransferase/mannose-6-phosphate isomerase